MTIVRLDASQPMPASLAGAVIALGNFDGFHRVDTHHGIRDVSIETTIDGIPPTHGHTTRNDSDFCTHGIARLA